MQQDMHSGVEEDREWIEGRKRDTESERVRERERRHVGGEGGEDFLRDWRSETISCTQHTSQWLLVTLTHTNKVGKSWRLSIRTFGTISYD